MQQEDAWTHQRNVNNTIFSLVAASIMLGLGVEEKDIPNTMRYLEENNTAGGPQEIFTQIQTAIIAARNDFLISAEDYDSIEFEE